MTLRSIARSLVFSALFAACSHTTAQGIPCRYEVAHVGYSQWNGVAILSRVGLADVEIGFPGQPSWGDDPDAEARALGATCGGVRVWSAGCASGEEPYTIAMLLAEAASEIGRPEWFSDVRIDATDVDRVSLERTRAARYPVDAMVDLPAPLLERWCRRDGDAWVVSDALRRAVAVHAVDLGRDRPPAPVYDLICCRNVVIYFGRDVQERLFERFTDALAPGGYLVLGKVETLVGVARDRLRLIEPRERIYQMPA